MENDKQWEKPEMTILFSGNVDEHVMKRSFGAEDYNDDESAIVNGQG